MPTMEEPMARIIVIVLAFFVISSPVKAENVTDRCHSATVLFMQMYKQYDAEGKGEVTSEVLAYFNLEFKNPTYDAFERALSGVSTALMQKGCDYTFDENLCTAAQKVLEDGLVRRADIFAHYESEQMRDFHREAVEMINILEKFFEEGSCTTKKPDGPSEET